MDEVHITSPASTAHVPPLGIQPVSPPKPKEDPKPNPHQPKIPYPSRLDKTKILNKNDVQIYKFLKILKQLHFDISLMDDLTQIPKYHNVLKDLLKDKEKLEELANTLINAECYAILLNKVPEKLGDPRKFLIPCILQDLEVCNSLADSGASINLMPFLMYEKLGIGYLKPTRMTLELANRSVALPKGIAQDVIVKVDKFNFLADFVVFDFEPDPIVPIILGRPFLRTAKALVDLDKPISGSTTFSFDSSPSLTPFELALFDPFPPGNEDDNFDPEADLREIEYLLNRDPSTVSSPTTDIDIIDPILERFTDEPALIYSSPPRDDDDDLFDFKSDNDDWKKLLYGNSFNDTHSENDKSKDSNTKSLIDELESSVLLPQLLISDLTLHEELLEFDTLTSFPSENEDKVFNPGILVHGSTYFVTNLVTQDKNFMKKTSSEASLILEELNFMSIPSDHELPFHYKLPGTKTLLSFSYENEDKVFNPGILISKGVYSLTLGLSHRNYEAFKIDNVKMLLEGSELTKEDRESQLYDNFKHFCQNKGETIHDYYVWFAKLINDMRNIKITMSRMQLNLKFVNNMLPEWGRFVTVVKLNRGLRDSNYDQLYAYLKQHEAHANENKMMLDRFTQHIIDPLALMSNVSHQYYSQSSINPPSTYNRGQGNNARGAGVAGFGGSQNRVGNANPGQSRQIKCYNSNDIGHIASNCTQLKRPQNLEYFKDKMLLMQAQENGVALVKEQLLFIAGGQDNAVDEDVDEQPVQDLALNVDNAFQADDCDAFDSDVDEAPTTQTTFMVNLSFANPIYDEAGPSYDLNILSEVDDNDHYQDAVYDHHEVHEMHDDVQPNYIVDSHADYTSDSNMIPYDQYVKDNAPTHYASVTTQNNVVDKSLTAELATYKEQVELYERRAKFELTERGQKIDEQLRIIITDQLSKSRPSFKTNQALDGLLPSQSPDQRSSPGITPTGLTEGERGFEQTKECYLTEVIPFFKTLKEHFEGIQKALTKEVKEMKEIFEELEAEVDQNVVNRKHDEIERKNLLITNDNLIVDCMSKEVFYIATNSELTVSRFTEMHDAHTVVQARCLELEAELSKLHDKVQKDDHTELVKRFSNLEVNHLNLQLKYQNLKERFGNNTSPPARDAPDFDSVFVIEKMKASIQGKDNAIKKLRMQISQLNETRSETDRTLDFRALDFQITQLTDKVTLLQEQNELFRAENSKIKQHYKELYDSIKITRAKHIE
ncbi:integrase, catalytic region, zinc finger, CCHC-type containing protein [Tanacetum coccineum]